jgi:hypothetical protein
LVTQKEVAITIAAGLAVLSVISIRAYHLAESEIIIILVGIMLASIPPVIIWGFRGDLNFKGHVIKLQHRKEPIIGIPDNIENGVRHYRNRSKLPSFADMTSIARNNIRMIAITFTTLRLNDFTVIESLLDKGITITFLLLEPKPQYIAIQQHLFIEAKNLENQITDSLKSFCDLKKRYPNHVVIKIYDELAPRSIIIVDDDYIKVEDHPIGSDAQSRPNHAAFKKSNKDFFDLYSLEYNRFEKKSIPYTCQ